MIGGQILLAAACLFLIIGNIRLQQQVGQFRADVSEPHVKPINLAVTGRSPVESIETRGKVLILSLKIPNIWQNMSGYRLQLVGRGHLTAWSVDGPAEVISRTFFREELGEGGSFDLIIEGKQDETYEELTRVPLQITL